VQMDLQKWADIGTMWNVPVFVGEFGYHNDRDEAPDFIRANYDAFDALGLSATQWEYSVSKDPWNMEIYGVVAADGTEYPMTASLIRPYARAVAGDAITTSFDAGMRVFRLDYAGVPAGVTEVSLPARAFPNGYDAFVSGGCVDTSHAGKVLIQADASAEAGAPPVSLKITSK